MRVRVMLALVAGLRAQLARRVLDTPRERMQVGFAIGRSKKLISTKNGDEAGGFYS
jgi:hypothetical protein